MIEQRQFDLIIGSGGFIGSELFTALCATTPVIGIQRGCRHVWDPERNINAKEYFPSIHEAVQSLFEGFAIRSVYYLISGLKPNSNRKMFLLDSEQQKTIFCLALNLATQCNATFNYLSSGGAVYGSYKKYFSENDICKPNSFYGVSKLRQENLIKDYAVSNNLNYNIFRPTNVYGSSQIVKQGQGLIANCIDKSNTGEILDLFTSVNTAKDYIHISDLLRQIIYISHKVDPGHTYNLGSGEILTIREILENVQLNYDGNLVYKQMLGLCTDDTILVDTTKVGTIMERQKFTLKNYFLSLKETQL